MDTSRRYLNSFKFLGSPSTLAPGSQDTPDEQSAAKKALHGHLTMKTA